MLWLESELALRRLTSADARLLSIWLTDPRVLAFYEGRDHPFDEDAVRNTFIERNDGDIVQNIVLYRSAPVGYLQF
jgi:aminoglycoside 6'-N-acetyltransferase